MSGIESIKTPLLTGTVNQIRYDKDAETAPPTAGGIIQNFSKALNHEMDSLNTLQNNANAAQEAYATGGDIEIHTVMLAGEKADVAMQLAMQIRNKAVSAYQEISRMSV